jgi:hypothetical protein
MCFFSTHRFIQLRQATGLKTLIKRCPFLRSWCNSDFKLTLNNEKDCFLKSKQHQQNRLNSIVAFRRKFDFWERREKRFFFCRRHWSKD